MHQYNKENESLNKNRVNKMNKTKIISIKNISSEAIMIYVESFLLKISSFIINIYY